MAWVFDSRQGNRIAPSGKIYARIQLRENVTNELQCFILKFNSAPNQAQAIAAVINVIQYLNNPPALPIWSIPLQVSV